MPQRWTGQFANGYRIRQGNVVGFVANPYQTGFVGVGVIRVVYDDGSEDDLTFDPSRTTTAGSPALTLTGPAKKDGWVVGGSAGFRGSGTFKTTFYGQIGIFGDIVATPANLIMVIGTGFGGTFRAVTVGQFIDDDFQATWVFQGTVLEDATGGTHVCSLTVTPGAGNEFVFLSGLITVGNSAGNQSAQAFIDDGTNNLIALLNANANNDTNANLGYAVPMADQAAEPLSTNMVQSVAQTGFIVSGTMRLRLSVTTATVSLTQTFAIACRIKGAPPTATLADTVGTPVLTTNTNAVFG